FFSIISVFRIRIYILRYKFSRFMPIPNSYWRNTYSFGHFTSSEPFHVFTSFIYILYNYNSLFNYLLIPTLLLGQLYNFIVIFKLSYIILPIIIILNFISYFFSLFFFIFFCLFYNFSYFFFIFSYKLF